MIGKTLKSRRVELGLSAEEVATAVGVSPSTYREWENGRNIQGEPYARLAEALDLRLSALFGIDSTEQMKNIQSEIEALETCVRNIKKYTYLIT